MQPGTVAAVAAAAAGGAARGAGGVGVVGRWWLAAAARTRPRVQLHQRAAGQAGYQAGAVGGEGYGPGGGAALAAGAGKGGQDGPGSAAPAGGGGAVAAPRRLAAGLVSVGCHATSGQGCGDQTAGAAHGAVLQGQGACRWAQRGELLGCRASIRMHPRDARSAPPTSGCSPSSMVAAACCSMADLLCRQAARRPGSQAARAAAAPVRRAVCTKELMQGTATLCEGGGTPLRRGCWRTSSNSFQGTGQAKTTRQNIHCQPCNEALLQPGGVGGTHSRAG